MRKLSISVVYALSTLVLMPVFAGDLSVDVVEGTLNGKKLESLTVDAVTDMLGRPTEAYEMEGMKVLKYHNDGLWIGFKDGSVCVDVHVVRQEDMRGAIYEKYRGKLNKNVDGNWKTKKFTDEFPSFDLVGKSEAITGSLCLKGSNTWVQVKYDLTSGFLNSVAVASRKGGRISDFCPSGQ